MGQNEALPDDVNVRLEKNIKRLELVANRIDGLLNPSKRVEEHIEDLEIDKLLNSRDPALRRKGKKMANIQADNKAKRLIGTM